MVIANGKHGRFEVQVPIRVLHDGANRIRIFPLVMEMVDPAQGGGVFRMRIVEHPLRHIDPVSQDIGEQAGSIVREIAP
jgi:hypothetical protein